MVCHAVPCHAKRYHSLVHHATLCYPAHIRQCGMLCCECCTVAFHAMLCWAAQVIQCGIGASPRHTRLHRDLTGSGCGGRTCTRTSRYYNYPAEDGPRPHNECLMYHVTLCWAAQVIQCGIGTPPRQMASQRFYRPWLRRSNLFRRARGDLTPTMQHASWQLVLHSWQLVSHI